MQFDHRRAGALGRLHLSGIRIDEQGDADSRRRRAPARLGRPARHWPRDIETAFGGDLLRAIRAPGSSPAASPAGDPDHLLGHRHFEIHAGLQNRRISVTSRSWMWRRSSRRCSVMLSAPDCSASSAACIGIGILNAPRLAKRRHMIDVHAQRDAARSGQGVLMVLPGQRSAAASPASPPAISSRPSRQASSAARSTRFASRKRACVPNVSPRDRPGSAVDRARRLGHAGLRSALRRKTIIPSGSTACPRPCATTPNRSPIVQQPLLEAAQSGLLLPRRRTTRDAGGIGGENLRMRIAALGQLQAAARSGRTRSSAALCSIASGHRRFPRVIS